MSPAACAYLLQPKRYEQSVISSLIQPTAGVIYTAVFSLWIQSQHESGYQTSCHHRVSLTAHRYMLHPDTFLTSRNALSFSFTYGRGWGGRENNAAFENHHKDKSDMDLTFQPSPKMAGDA